MFFEIVSLFPLFPGTNELDQINKIHKILGTPAQELLEKFKRHSAHVDFNFPQTGGSGVAKLIPHVPPVLFILFGPRWPLRESRFTSIDKLTSRLISKCKIS